jgi:hypothetical protein
MQTRQIMAAGLVALLGMLCGTSCMPGQEAASETEGTRGGSCAPTLEPESDGEPFDSDPDVGVEAAGNPQVLAVCLALAPASVPTKEAFCRSLPDSGSRGRCWKYRWNRAEWIGWCYAEFAD